MASRKPVVRNRSKLPEPRLHALLMEGWSRAIADHGKGAFADALEISAKGLDKQLTGSMPGFSTILDAFDHDDRVLDDVFAEKGVRLVPSDAVCDVDDLNLLIARALLKINEATHPDGSGGRSITHTEYLDAETVMRALNAASGKWLQRCTDIRKPRAA